MIETIRNCYDSHAHFLATGQVASGLRLQGLRAVSDVAQLRILPQYYQGSWLVGFGWDQNLWSPVQLPQKKDLDAIFPTTPVFFSRIDGHASWLNSCALEALAKLEFHFDEPGLQPAIGRDERGELSGILYDQAHIQALKKLPPFSDAQLKLFLQVSQNIFNRAGFTHVRDLSMNRKTWDLLTTFYEKKELTVCLDSFVTAENLNEVSSVIQEITEMKKSPCPQLKVHGVKIFVDGSLGSRTAYLSENYLGTTQNGLLIWSFDDIAKAIEQTWVAGLDFAVHCIGDQATDEVVRAARQVSARGVLGRLHLEHVEVLRSETVQLMKALHVICYMQPCHWLSDHEWLKNSLSAKLHKNIFQWELLRKNKIPFYFGSDSPIESPSLSHTMKALSLSSQAGVPRLQEDWKKFSSHPDSKWTNSWTEIESGNVVQVYFDGQVLL